MPLSVSPYGGRDHQVGWINVAEIKLLIALDALDKIRDGLVGSIGNGGFYH